MSDSLPIHFLPIDPVVDPHKDQEMEPLIGAGYACREQSGLLVCVSRNWWHLSELEDAARRLNSESLNFLWGSEQALVLETRAIADAITMLVMVLAEASDGSDSLGTTSMMESYRTSTRQAHDNAEFSNEDQQLFMQAYLKAEIKLDVDCEYQGDDGEIVSYFSFLKSLFDCLNGCLLNGKSLLYYQVFP